MGYLDNSTITVDAILTKRGRELLAMGGGSVAMGQNSPFQITQFALADDEIDYDLWNPAHPLGSAYYGTVIENMPVTEAVPDETQVMKYKLVTFPRGAYAIPYLQSNVDSITIKVDSTGPTNRTQPQSEREITVYTYFKGERSIDFPFNKTAGYHVHLLDSTFITMNQQPTPTLGFAGPVVGSFAQMQPSQLMGTAVNTSVAANVLPGVPAGVTPATEVYMKLAFDATARGLEAGVGTKSTKVIITGNETGGRIVIPITLINTRT